MNPSRHGFIFLYAVVLTTFSKLAQLFSKQARKSKVGVISETEYTLPREAVTLQEN